MPKKKYEVIKATTRELSGLKVGGRVKNFAHNGTFETSDPGEAAEIDKVLGAKGTGEVVVTSYDEKEPGHNYRFTGVDLKRRGGGERVKVKTASGFTYVSLTVALEEGLQIIPKRKRKGAQGAEVQHA